jgi:hypothetical protein
MTHLQALLTLIHDAKAPAASRTRYRKVLEASAKLHLTYHEAVEIEKALEYRDDAGILHGWVNGTDTERA